MTDIEFSSIRSHHDILCERILADLCRRLQYAEFLDFPEGAHQVIESDSCARSQLIRHCFQFFQAINNVVNRFEIPVVGASCVKTAKMTDFRNNPN